MVQKQSRILMLVLVLITIFIMQTPYVVANTGNETLEYEGEDYVVKISCSAGAKIPKESYLKVEELLEGSIEYDTHFQKTQEFLSEETERQLMEARFFDVSIMNGEEEIEPDESVKVSIQYKEPVQKEEQESLSVIHFVEDGSKELLEVDEKKDIITFEQDSFSVIGVIVFDSIDTKVQEVHSELIEGAKEIHVEKEWSDGADAHAEDAVEITLYDYSEKKDCKTLTLHEGNHWKGEFLNLDEEKGYTIRETKVTSEDQEKASAYKSSITNENVKKWCPVENHSLEHGQQILLVCGDDKKQLIRKSSTYDQMYLKTQDIAVAEHEVYGEYCTTEITNRCIWKTLWVEEQNAWHFYSEIGDAYLALNYNEESDCYEWTTTQEESEGTFLVYEEGLISATVNGVTKYLGNITEKGPYEGVDKEDVSAVRFQMFSYKIFEPVVCKVFNQKNKEIEQEIKADVVTSKTIDYLGDGVINSDVKAETNKLSEKILKDLYRLNLGMNMQTDQTGMDLLMVIDVSSSMKENKDAKDEKGNLITRSEALRQALNQFIPSFLQEHTKNNLSMVAFENEAMILQDWTKNAAEILEKINFESEGELTLYNGKGTNYEAALMRAHEVLASCGKTGNKKAMLFLSDGYPTNFINGNDELERGNVTVSLGKAYLSDAGIEAIFSTGLEPAWDDGERVTKAANEAIISFKNHNADIMVGTIAFHTLITDSLKKLASSEEFVTHVESATPDDLLNAMELITEFGPSKIVVMDELSENVDIFKESPDFKVIAKSEDGKETLLFSTEDGLTEEGKKVLDEEQPVLYENRIVKMQFRKDYQVQNNVTYYLSFNVTASQEAFDKYADVKGEYSEKGDDDTDYEGNDTSSSKDGFYSNGEETKVQYTMNGVQYDRKYRKPVIQVREGFLSVVKTDLNGERLGSGVTFSLYRRAEEGDKEKVSFEEMDGEFVKVASGSTNAQGEVLFEHLRLSVFDTGYFYYMREDDTIPGYTKCSPVEFHLYEEEVELIGENELVHAGQKVREDGTTIGEITVKNREEMEFSFTKVAADDYEDRISGALFSLEILSCSDSTHVHGDECWTFLEKAKSDPQVTFTCLSSGNIYRLKETKASESCYCPEGFWLIRTGNNKEIEIEASEGMPDLKKLQDGNYILENEKVMNIPVTGGGGNDIYYMIAMILIAGGIILWVRRMYFQN